MQVILIGGFPEIFELCEECGYEIIGYIDAASSRIRYSHYPYPLLGSDNDFPFMDYKHLSFFITPDSPIIREIIHQRMSPLGINFISLISPGSKISKTAKIGQGVCLQYGCHISSSSKIGDFVKLNVKANIMHDCTVGDYSTLAPDSSIMGGVVVGRKCYIGANATIIPEVELCDNVTIGAGAVVTKDIVEPGVYVGIPARRIK